MVFEKLTFFVSVLVCVCLLSSFQVHCNENEDALLRGINGYRQSLKLSNLTKQNKACCLADKIADDLEYHLWNGTDEFTGCDPTGEVARLVHFPKYLRACDILPNTTVHGVVLPVNVPKLSDKTLLTNYTDSAYAKFLKDSKFTGAGVGIKSQWTVLILATRDPTGNFSGAVAVAVAESLPVMVSGLLFAVTLLFFS